MQSNAQRFRHVLWGGYGWGNIGDDLTLAVAGKDALAKGGPVAVLAPRPALAQRVLPQASVAACVPGTPRHGRGRWWWLAAELALAQGAGRLALRFFARAADRTSIPDPDPHWAQTVAAAGVLHLVGGGYLSDLFNLNRFLRPVRLARALGVRVETSPLGIGPFRRPTAARRVARALRGTKLRVRDATSTAWCEEMGLLAEEVRDDGFRLKEVIALPSGRPGTRSSGGEVRRVGVCVFPQHGSTWGATQIQWWVKCLEEMRARLPACELEGFCFHSDPDSDWQTTLAIFHRAGLDLDRVSPPEGDFRRAIAGLGRFDAVVTTRFHAAVAASVLGTRYVALAGGEYYLAKMRSVLKYAPTPGTVVDVTLDPPDAVARALAKA